MPNPNDYNLMNFAQDNGLIRAEKVREYVDSTATHIQTVAEQVFKEAYPLVKSKGLSDVFSLAFFLMVQEEIKRRYKVK